jgi:hypothetical protein
MDHFLTNALMMTLCQSDIYLGEERVKLPHEAFDLDWGQTVKSLLNGLGKGLVLLGQTLEQWGQPATVKYQIEYQEEPRL